MAKSSVAARVWYDDAEDVSLDAIEAGVEDVLRSLPEAQQQVLRAHFGIGEEARSLTVIAAECGLSDAQLQRLERRALRELRTRAVLVVVAQEDVTKIG